MAIADIDFEGTNEVINDDSTKETNNVVNNQEDITNFNGNDVVDINKDNNKNEINDKSNKEDETDNKPSTGELVEGTQLVIDGSIYTVDSKGNILDDKGNIFKEAKDVKEWLELVDVEDNNDKDNSINISSIQEALGVSITDDEGKAVEFTNDANGVKSYVDSVIELRSKELQEAAINRLYQDNPILKQFQDYVQLNGTHRGFGELPDRSGIQLNKDNEAQLVAVIKMAASEFGNKSLNDNYINYLKDSGNLFNEAQNQLNALIDKDNSFRKEIETKAKEQREQEAKEVTEYWNNVNKLIEGRVISGYKIPDSFTKEVDGKKIVVTPNDFFTYLSVPKQSEDGRVRTDYQRDLDKLSDDEYLQREMLDAWLMFTGGTYKDLMDMALKEDKVRQLKIKSKEIRSSKTIKIIKPSSKKSSIDDILL